MTRINLSKIKNKKIIESKEYTQSDQNPSKSYIDFRESSVFSMFDDMY